MGRVGGKSKNPRFLQGFLLIMAERGGQYDPHQFPQIIQELTPGTPNGKCPLRVQRMSQDTVHRQPFLSAMALKAAIASC